MDKAALAAEIKRAVVRAVVDGVPPQDVLAAVVAVAAWMVGEVPDPAKRKEHLDHVLAMLPRAVAYVSAGRMPVEAERRTLQ